jgi:hypothetical protein
MKPRNNWQMERRGGWKGWNTLGKSKRRSKLHREFIEMEIL